MSFFENLWTVIKPEITGLLGTEQSRQDKVTGLLIDKPFEFGKNIGLYDDKIKAPDLINTTNPNNTVKQNAIASMNDSIANMERDSEIFRKNLPASMFEIGEFGIDLAMNPIKYGKKALSLGSGLIYNALPDHAPLKRFADWSDKLIGYEDQTKADSEMASMVVDSTIEFFETPGALRKAMLENPADVLAMLMGGSSIFKKLVAEKPQEVLLMKNAIERIGHKESLFKRIGAIPVGLSMKDVSVISGKDVVESLKKMGTDASEDAGKYAETGGFVPHTLKEIENENFTKQTVGINELISGDAFLKDYIESNPSIRDFDKDATMPIVVDSKGAVRDGYNRINQALKNGETEIEILKGSNTELSKVGGTDLATQRQLANVDASGFYSKAEQVILDQMPKDLPQNQLRGWFEKRRVSKTELEDLGILALVDNMEIGEKVTKEGLLQHIADQNLTFSNTTLDDNASRNIDLYDEDIQARQDFEIPDAGVDFMNRYNDGDVNWDHILASADEPDDWLNISGNEWRLSPDSSDRATNYGQDIFDDEIGSSVNVNPSSDGEIARIRGGQTYHYPFNNKTKKDYPDEEDGSINKNYMDFRSFHDDDNLKFTKYMHFINPERYPKTKSMELKILYQDYNQRKKLDEVYLSDRERETYLPRSHGQLDTQENYKNKIAMLEASIEDDIRNDKMEWDIKMLREAAYLHNPWDMEGEDRLKMDMVEAQEMMGRDRYLESPEFEIDVEVGGEEYQIYGNEDIGYVVSTPNDGLEHRDRALQDLWDLPTVESAIRNHARDEGYIDEWYDGANNEGSSTKWENYTLNRHHRDAPQENYKEELIILSPDKEQLRGGYQFESGVHYGGHKGLFAHLRKSDRRELGTNSNDVYFIEEAQSDFQQSRRELGATKAETDDLKYQNRMESSATGDMLTAWNALDYGKKRLDGERSIASPTSETIGGDLVWKKLVKTSEQKALYKQAMLAQTDQYQLSNFQSTSGEQKKKALEQVKSWNDNWHLNTRNPDSESWAGLSFDEYEELGQYLSEHQNELQKTGRKLDDHSHTSRTPIQGDRWYKTVLNYAIMKAVEEGKSTISWANSDQILDQWNPGRDTIYTKKIKFKESYVNTYDRKLKKAAEKYAKDYDGEFEIIKIDLGDGNHSENFSIRITPEMIDKLMEEFPANTETGFARPTHGKLQQIPSGLLKTDVTEQQGLLV